MLRTRTDLWGSPHGLLSGKPVDLAANSDHQLGKQAIHWLSEPRPVQAFVENAVESIPLARSQYQGTVAGGATAITRIIIRAITLTVTPIRQTTAMPAENM